ARPARVVRGDGGIAGRGAAVGARRHRLAAQREVGAGVVQVVVVGLAAWAVVAAEAVAVLVVHHLDQLQRAVLALHVGQRDLYGLGDRGVVGVRVVRVVVGDVVCEDEGVGAGVVVAAGGILEGVAVRVERDP